MLRAFSIVAFVVILVSPALGADPGGVDHSLFDSVLKDNVHNGQVDYLMIRKNKWSELNQYLDKLADVHPKDIHPRDKLPFYINLYNATIIHTVIERLRDGYSPFTDSPKVFEEPLVRCADQTFTLNKLKDDIIGRIFKDPRIHATLVSASGCSPPLMSRAYRGEGIAETLDASMRRFLSDHALNQIDKEHKILRLSRIFDRCADDFGGEAKLPGYVNGFIEEDVAGFKVEFIECSKKLNIIHPREGRWVKVAVDKTGVMSGPQEGDQAVSAQRGEVFEVLGEKGDWLHIDRPFTDADGWIKSCDTAPLSLSKSE